MKKDKLNINEGLTCWNCGHEINDETDLKFAHGPAFCKMCINDYFVLNHNDFDASVTDESIYKESK